MDSLLFTSVELGLLYAIVVLGVFLTFRILNFPDLTVDSSFVLGAAATAIFIRNGVPGILSIFVGFIAGFLGGSLTAILHTKLGIGKILSGILSMSILYTVNLRLMHGPNVSLLNQPGIIEIFKVPTNHFYLILFLITVVLIIKFLIDWFLQTEFGLWFRATGNNEVTAQSFSINTKLTKFIGIGLSNGLVGFAGGLITQYQGFSDINMGVGTVILSLAALMLGEALTSKNKIPILTFVIVIGAILYQLIVNIALQLGLAGSDLKFITALIVIISLLIGGRNKFLSYEKQLFNN